MRRVLACLLALALGAACALLVACGGDGKGLIGSSDADAMRQQLDQIESSVRRGECEDLSSELTDLQQQVNGLPKRVDAALRTRLQEGVDNLFQISPERCAAQAAKTDTTPVETTPTVPTETTPTTPTETTPTETTPPQTTPTTPPETTPTTPQTTEPPPTTTGGSGGATVPGDTGGAGSGAGGTSGGTAGGTPTP